MATKGTVLVAGAGGLVGRAVIDHHLGAGWDVLGLSRRAPDPATGACHIALDLTDAAACRAALAPLSAVTHLVYAALYEKPGLTQGWLEDDQIAVNRAMLANLLDALPQDALRHVTLLQGAKAYGVHLGQVPVPARESAPRHMHPNFYWAQEDLLTSRQQGRAWRWTVLRPQVVLGFALGSAMNMVAAIGAYAAISHALGLPLVYPGTGDRVTEATDARLLARAIAWAGASEAAADQVFNVTNGDVLTWRNLWPAAAQACGIGVGQPHPMPLAAVMPGRGETWRTLAERHGLHPVPLDRLVGASWQLADFAFSRTHSTASLLSTIKIRQAGFGECIDTEASLAFWLRDMQARRYLPGAEERASAR